jgi:hypothetical protein
MSFALKKDERVAAEQLLVRRETPEQLIERERAVAVGEDRLGVLRGRGCDQLRAQRDIDQEPPCRAPAATVVVLAGSDGPCR